MQTYFPQNYMQYQPNIQSQYQQPHNGVVWVQGIEGAKAYPVASGASVLLMDSEENVFYIKTTDQSGMPSPLRVFDYTERTDTAKIDTSAFVTRDELEKRLSELNRKPKVKEKKDE